MPGRVSSSRPRRHPRNFQILSEPGDLALEARTLLSAVDVLSYHGNQANTNNQPNTGLNAAETMLIPSNVTASTFGKLFDTPVDGQIYAQPLVKTGVNITVGAHPGTHNVVFVATEHNSLYAVDAASGLLLWHDSFINPGAGITTVPSVDTGDTEDLSPEIGVTSTPVIDPATNTLYLVAKTKEVRADGTHYVLKLHAINLSSGAEASSGPATIADTLVKNLNSDGLSPSFTYVVAPEVAGTGEGDSGGDQLNGMLELNALRTFQRCTLTLINGSVFMESASHGDVGPYHGWILGFSAATLRPTAVFCTTPNGMDGGIWESGAGLTVDPQGFLYCETGNGTFDTTVNAQGFPINGNYGNSLIKLQIDPNSSAAHPNINGWGLKVVDYFTPPNQDELDAADLDFGSGGPMILPDSVGTAATPHLMLAAGKDPVVYVINRDNMGHYNPDGGNYVQALAQNLNSTFSTPAFQGSTLYYVSRQDYPKAFTVTSGQIQTPAISTATAVTSYPGATPSLSFNGTSDGIMWMTNKGTHELMAYDATNLNSLLYSSSQNSTRDGLNSVVKFQAPTVANGMVYVGTGNSIAGFGLLPNPPTSAHFSTQDSSTSGHWNYAYGAQGYEISQDPAASIPAHVSVAFTGSTDTLYAATTTDPRALRPAASVNGATGLAAGWTAPQSFSIHVKLSDGLSHQVSLYAVDWGNLNRNETIQVISDSTGAVLDSRTNAGFQNGTYLTWNVQGNVTFKVSSNTAASAVVSGLFFGDRPTVPGSANFVGLDTAKQGNWKGTFGADGFSIAQDPSASNPSIPSYAQVTFTGDLAATWTTDTTNPTALQQGDPGTSNRVAGLWYTDTSFRIDLKLNGAATRQVALYALDWDNAGRTETIQVISNSSGTILDTQSLSNFQSGKYLVWNVSGDVSFVVTNTGPSNAVLSGLFLSTPPQVLIQPSAAIVSNNGTATLTAQAATGNPATTVQWQTSTNGGQTWTKIAGATSTTYTTGLVSASNSGHLYRAVFSNLLGTATTRAVSVSLVHIPVVLSQPTPTTVLAGHSATFTAAASGSPTPSTQWQLSTDSGQTWSNISGAANATYTTAATTQASNGQRFRAVFTNSQGTITSSAVTLTVYSMPVITRQPVSITLKAVGRATFTAAATGNPGPTVQWQISNDAGRTWTNIAKATKTAYTTGLITLLKSGTQYRAVFSSSTGSATTSVASVSFIRPNKIKAKPHHA